jgi:hypothetical protein
LRGVEEPLDDTHSVSPRLWISVGPRETQESMRVKFGQETRYPPLALFQLGSVDATVRELNDPKSDLVPPGWSLLTMEQFEDGSILVRFQRNQAGAQSEWMQSQSFWRHWFDRWLGVSVSSVRIEQTDLAGLPATMSAQRPSPLIWQLPATGER